jgi:hypothetical protein
MNKHEILEEALVAREQEIMGYQINIDNYTIALEEISKLSVEEKAELSGFADQLRTLLSSEKLEQKKAKIMFAVIQRQLNA